MDAVKIYGPEKELLSGFPCFNGSVYKRYDIIYSVIIKPSSLNFIAMKVYLVYFENAKCILFSCISVSFLEREYSRAS